MVGKTDNVKYVHPANRQFVNDRTLELKPKKEITDNIALQVGRSGCLVIIILLSFFLGLILFGVFAGALLVNIVGLDNQLLAIVIGLASLAAVIFSLLNAYSTLLYLYGVFRFAYNDTDGEKTYQWLAKHGKITRGKITDIRHLKPDLFVSYRFSIRGIPRIKSYYLTSHASSRTLKAGDKVLVLYNENVSILL